MRILGLVLATLSLTACLNSTTLVKVKPDGSGTVEQTTLVNTAALKGMMGAQGGSSAPMMKLAVETRTRRLILSGHFVPYATEGVACVG